MGNPDENSVFELMNKRKAIEDEIRRFESILDENGVGMKDSLVDAEQYPRSDIDIPAVREARRRINELNFDYGELMKKIESGLEEYYRTAKNAEPSSNNTMRNRNNFPTNNTTTTTSTFTAVPSMGQQANPPAAPLVREYGLARVDQVFENSPAYHSGTKSYLI